MDVHVYTKVFLAFNINAIKSVWSRTDQVTNVLTYLLYYNMS